MSNFADILNSSVFTHNSVKVSAYYICVFQLLNDRDLFLKRVDSQEKKLIMYFDKVNCIAIKAHMVYIRIYIGYAPYKYKYSKCVK